MGFNYRLMAHEHKLVAHKNKYVVELKLHEVHYKGKTDKQPIRYSADGAIAHAGTVEEMTEVMERMKVALTKPILWAGKKFPQVYIQPKLKRRIFIVSDILHDDELSDAAWNAADIAEANGEAFLDKVFDETLDFAWRDLEKTWESVKKADQIFANTSFVPLVNKSYTGAPVIFNGMMERAIKEEVRGKEVYIMQAQKDIEWDMIDMSLMKKAFKHNTLFMYDDNRKMVKVDVRKIKK